MKRVVITGIGAVTPLGNSMEATWENLNNKVSGTGLITRFDAVGLKSTIAGELKGFNPEDYITKKDMLRLDPFVHYAAAAALMACEDAGIESNAEVLRTAAVIMGSSRGGITSLEKGLVGHLAGKRFSAFLMSSSTINMAASYITMKLGIKGPSLGISTACASGTSSIGEAFRMIRNGYAEIAFAGGAEAPVCRLAVGGYGDSGALSRRNDEPEKASRPFDKDRDGFVIAEGAGVLVLEELEHAQNRGAKIYAEVAGYGVSSDAFHQTMPDSDGEALAIKKALAEAGISAAEIDYINAHATSTPRGDAAEAEAIKKVFAEHLDDIYVGSCKCMLGHMLGAAGAVEAAITAMTIKRDTIVPVINLEEPDAGCDFNFAFSAVEKKIRAAVTNSFGFGGVNAVLVLKRSP